jgi:octaprenyl-diphosphate synthase
MTIDTIKNLVAEDLKLVNHRMKETLKDEQGFVNTLGHHLIDGGGKRLRPLAVLLSSRACAYEGNHHINAAILVECFHTATLLHDDVVDDSKLRRGKETANSLWGSEASVLVGDFLLTLTLELLLNIDNNKVQRLMSKTVHEICRGELKQLANRNNLQLSPEDYFDIIRSKTALLFAASTSVGPLLQNQNHPLEKAFYNYGIHLGNAFQLIDDTLDYCADPKVTGKNSGDDLADGKLTLPILHVLKHGNEIQRKLIQTSFEQSSLSHFPDILDAIDATGAIEYTRATANREKNLAIECLEDVPDSPYKEALIELAVFALERNY